MEAAMSADRNGLSPEARALLEAARAADEAPSDRERERMRNAVLAQIAGGPGGPGLGPEADAPPTPSPLPPFVEAPSPTVAPPSTLEAEMSLLRSAELELRANRPQAALALLDAHAVEHANGILAEERRAERAMALCALG